MSRPTQKIISCKPSTKSWVAQELPLLLQLQRKNQPKKKADDAAAATAAAAAAAATASDDDGLDLGSDAESENSLITVQGNTTEEENEGAAVVAAYAAAAADVNQWDFY